METTKKLRWVSEDSWIATFASLLPFWLLSVVIMAEGFPRPLIPGELIVPVFVLTVVISIILLWRGWLGVDILLYSLLPVILMFEFDEISTTYKSPFIMLCGAYFVGRDDWSKTQQLYHGTLVNPVVGCRYNFGTSIACCPKLLADGRRFMWRLLSGRTR